jgi:signal transduction histidine kinase
MNKSPLNNMEQAITELNADLIEEGREKSLKRYLQLAMPRLTSLNQDIETSLRIVSDQTAHMEEVLSQQDKFSYFKKTLEPLNLNMIIEDAIKMMPQNLRGAVEIEKDAGLFNLPPVSSERVVLIQVITNLLNNSSESILRKGIKKGNIWITGFTEIVEQINKVHIVIRDNGEGIDKDSRKKIFNRGYSTKIPNASGIGLHWCSNALAAMGADIHVESDGAGHGSSFHIMMAAFHV